MDTLIRGLLAGLGATGPMTLAMVVMHRLLPERERQPLPPRQLTVEAAGRAGVERMDEDEQHYATLAAHLGYGAAAGAAYARVAEETGGASVAHGVAFGLALWVAGYIGWVPALGFAPAAHRESPPRNALMIASHAVWGASVGLLVALTEPRGKHSSQRTEDA
jgi:uncharacterized membrane protein YagU involved in acid resistance